MKHVNIIVVKKNHVKMSNMSRVLKSDKPNIFQEKNVRHYH